MHLADQIDHNDIAPLVAILHEHRTKELYEKITVHYNYFKNTMKYIPTSMQIYPLSRKVWNTIMPDLVHVYAVPQHDEENTEHIMEPDPIALQLAAQEALSRYVILSAVLQNKTSEFASRMIAMK
ncbi:F0F1 ATP synthase subunit gamma [Patescibacteria group bacterium]|nr:F0F1 ATP synthase subunit gamma [Patescibacteria group bacterium]